MYILSLLVDRIYNKLNGNLNTCWFLYYICTDPSLKEYYNTYEYQLILQRKNRIR